jgi:hypothetical protein
MPLSGLPLQYPDQLLFNNGFHIRRNTRAIEDTSSLNACLKTSEWKMGRGKTAGAMSETRNATTCFKIGDNNATRCGKSWQAANSSSKSGSEFRKNGAEFSLFGAVLGYENR